LFRPSEAVAIVQGDDNGTPWQKDEPQAENAPVGGAIDYYLRSATSGPLTIEISDASGKVIRSFSSETTPPPPMPPQTVSVLWRRVPPALSTAAGMHRWIWDLRETPPPGGGGGFRQPQPMRTGTFTVKLTVDGQSLTQPLVVSPDPRAR
jgi:hypothetical protein